MQSVNFYLIRMEQQEKFVKKKTYEKKRKMKIGKITKRRQNLSKTTLLKKENEGKTEYEANYQNNRMN